MRETTNWSLWMHEAILQAKQAAKQGEVPVGAVVLDAAGRLTGLGHNAPIARSDPTAHAEIVALRRACRRAANYRLTGSVLVCTLEPCCMCVGAVVQARLAGVVFGTRDPKAGALVSRMRFPQDYAGLNHTFWIEEGFLSGQCAALLQRFFALRRGCKGHKGELDT